MKKFLRRRAVLSPKTEKSVQDAALDSVVDLRHRMFEDPDFKTAFIHSLMSAVTDTEEELFSESVSHPAAYGDETNSYISTDLHVMRGEAVLHIFGALIDLAEQDEHTAQEKATQLARNVRYAIGRLSREAYHQAQLEPPLQLRDESALGIYYEGIGQVVVWERVRELEEQTDNVSRLMKPPDDSPL